MLDKESLATAQEVHDHIDWCHTMKVPSVLDFAKIWRKIQPQLDTDKNGSVDNSELEAGMHNAKFKGNEAAALAAAKANQELLVGLSGQDSTADSVEPDSITADGIGKLSQLAAVLAGKEFAQDANIAKYAQYLPGINVLHFDFQDKVALSRLYRQAVDSISKSVASVNIESVCQGDIGNCGLIASIAAVASSRPEVITKMVEKNADGTYWVSTADGDKIPVRTPTVAEYARNQRIANGVWTTLLTDAFGKYGTSQARMIFGAPGVIPSANYESIKDDSCIESTVATEPRHALQFFLGDNARRFYITKSDQDSVDKGLRQAMTFNCASVAVSNVMDESKATESNITPTHAFTVLDYDAQHKLVTLRNPHGSSSRDYIQVKDESGQVINEITSSAGKIQVPLKQFCEYFAYVDYASDRPIGFEADLSQVPKLELNQVRAKLPFEWRMKDGEFYYQMFRNLPVLDAQKSLATTGVCQSSYSPTSILELVKH